MIPLDPLIKSLSRLPGIGEKSATRLAIQIFRDTTGLAQDLIKSLVHITEKVVFCQKCQNISEQDICDICSDTSRNTHLLCVVQEPVDLMMIEKTSEYKGLYHVLHGAISPLDGIGPEDLRVRALIERVSNEDIQEVILATNPNPEGETTALYLKKLLSASNTAIKISRIASGIPVGGTLEYADPKTLARSLGYRRDF
ncbi:MAG: recombination protein RecR [Deltaproteobacteria bacterium]|nr:MAG: recombination protein RecR [Deltaproteobacteria bacterium]